MKKLSRSDQTIYKLRDFLIIQGIIRDGTEDVFLNTLPYTTIIPILYDNKVKLYYCMALSICVPSSEIPLESNYFIDFANSKISSMDRVSYTRTNSNVYVYDVFDKVINIVIRSRIKKAKILDTTLKNLDVDLSEGRKFNGVYGVSLYSEKGLALTVTSSEPIIIEGASQKIDVFVPKSRILIFSTTIHTKMFRDVLVYEKLGVVKGTIKITQPLIEILDPIVLGIVEEVNRGCIDMVLINTENIDLNTIIKVYGYIDELSIDDLTKFKPRQSVIRIAMPSYSRSKVRLCVSISMPKRSDIFIKAKSFEQVF
jgi:hypothetical protein